MEVSDGEEDAEDEELRSEEQTAFLARWYQELWEKVLGAFSVYFRVAPLAAHKPLLQRAVLRLDDRDACFLDAALNQLGMVKDSKEKHSVLEKHFARCMQKHGSILKTWLLATRQTFVQTYVYSCSVPSLCPGMQ